MAQKRMTEVFTVTVPLVITFRGNTKYKEVQRLYKELTDFIATQEFVDYTIALGKGQLKKETVY